MHTLLLPPPTAVSQLEINLIPDEDIRNSNKEMFKAVLYIIPNFLFIKLTGWTNLFNLII